MNSSIHGDIISSTDVIERIEELRAELRPFVAGWNMPGYLPDSEPARFSDSDDAAAYIAEQMRQTAQDISDGIHCVSIPHDSEQACELFAELETAAAALESGSAADDAGEFGATIAGLHWFITRDESGAADDMDEDDREELRALESFADEMAGYCPDWEHGETLISDHAFTDYARDMAEDCGLIPNDAAWPCRHIDWQAAADELRADYTCADFDGVTYWGRC